MKNKMLIGILSAGVILSGALTVGATSNNSGEETLLKVTESQEMIPTEDREEKNQSSKQNIITEQEATDIAAKAVGGTVNEMELDEDDNRYVYEFELNTSKGEAEVKVDAVTGKVLEKEYDDDNDDDREEKDQFSKQNIITEQEAIDIAKKAVDGTVNEMELDEDDNRYVYEFELNTSKGEAEVKVDAASGKVLEKEYDDGDNDDLDD